MDDVMRIDAPQTTNKRSMTMSGRTGLLVSGGAGVAVLVAVVAVLAFGRAAQAEDPHKDKKDSAATRLEKFDELDYEAFSKQNWDLFHKTHTDDVVVVWPDGHETKGFDKHIEDMKYMFS
jgi:hypothetical protein